MFDGRRVVITGLGVLAPTGNDKESFWKALLAGRSGIGPVTHFDPQGLPCRIAGEVKGFDPLAFIPAELKPQKRMSRGAQFGIAVAKMALRDAGLELDVVRREATLPVIMGVSTSAMDLFSRDPTMFTASASVPHAVGSSIVYTLELAAKLFTISDGCASGVDAIGVAADEIRFGRASLALAGSAESAVTRYVFEGFGKSRKLSTLNGEPARASRPFDAARDGGVISEGAAIVVLEDLGHALSRGARIYAEVTGFGTCPDPPGGPDAGGMLHAIRRALASAGRRPDEVDHVNAHAPSDKQADVSEIETLKQAFGAHALRLSVTSIKGSVGNAMAAAGAQQVVATALSLAGGIVPPTANLETPDPACDLDCVAGGPRMARLETALVNSHGFGRGNSSLILERCREGLPVERGT